MPHCGRGRYLVTAATLAFLCLAAACTGHAEADEAFTLVDARSTEEYAAAHVHDAVNIPYDQLDGYDALLPADPGRLVVVYCRTGRRAGLLRDALLARGYTDVRVLNSDRITWHNGKGFVDGGIAAAVGAGVNED